MAFWLIGLGDRICFSRKRERLEDIDGRMTHTKTGQKTSSDGKCFYRDWKSVTDALVG